MCEALPPTLEKSARWLGVMDLTGWQSFICIRIYTYVYIYIYVHVCIHTYKHIRFTPCDSRRLFLRPAVCIWTCLSNLFPGCDFGAIFLGPVGCIRTRSAAILMTRGPYSETHELLFGSFLEFRARPAEPVGHFGSLFGKRYEKHNKWRSTGAQNLKFFNFF